VVLIRSADDPAVLRGPAFIGAQKAGKSSSDGSREAAIRRRHNQRLSCQVHASPRHSKTLPDQQIDPDIIVPDGSGKICNSVRQGLERSRPLDVERLLRGTITLSWAPARFMRGPFLSERRWFLSKSGPLPARLRNRPTLAALAIAGNEHWRGKWRRRLLASSVP
jgi:hypothetical protein